MDEEIIFELENIILNGPCKYGCQYAKDIGMLEHSCANGCMYEKYEAEIEESNRSMTFDNVTE